MLRARTGVTSGPQGFPGMRPAISAVTAPTVAPIRMPTERPFRAPILRLRPIPTVRPASAPIRTSLFAPVTVYPNGTTTTRIAAATCSERHPTRTTAAPAARPFSSEMMDIAAFCGGNLTGTGGRERRGTPVFRPASLRASAAKLPPPTTVKSVSGTRRSRLRRPQARPGSPVPAPTAPPQCLAARTGCRSRRGRPLRFRRPRFPSPARKRRRGASRNRPSC